MRCADEEDEKDGYSDEEYEEIIDFAVSLGIENAFVQEGGAVGESFIPPFDLEGV